MRIFLTGHRGFVGSNLLPRLIDLGHEVHHDMKVFDLYYWDCIIHLAATTTIDTRFNPLIYENNIVFAKKILSTPYQTIYASSCSAQYNTNPYAASKIYNEWLGVKQGRSAGLRFHNLYGSGNTKGIVWYLMNKKDGDKITIRGENTIRDYIHVSDAVDYIIQFLNNRLTGVFDVGSGIGTRTIDLVNLYMKLSGKRFEIETIPADESEPECMISNYPAYCLSLEQGLLKTINNA